MTLREEVEEAVRIAVEATSIAAVSPGVIVKRFLGRGATRNTLYVWIRTYLESGRALRTPIPPPLTIEAVVEPGSALAVAGPTPIDAAAAPVAPPPTPALLVMEVLTDCIRAAQQVMSFARKEDGTVRNAKLLLGASEHLRRSLDTAVRIKDGMRQDRDLDRFIDEMLAIVAQESPPAARRITERLLELMTLRGY